MTESIIELKGNNLKTFTYLTTILADMDKEVTINFNKENFNIKILSSNVAMGVFDLKAEFFDTYHIEEPTVVTLDTKLFSNIVKKLGKKDLKIVILENSIQFSSDKSSFALKYFDGIEIEQSLPQFEPTCKWVVPSEDFATLIEEHLAFSDYCKFESSDYLKTHIKGNLVNGEVVAEAKCIFTPHDEETGEAISQTASYDIKYLTIVTKIKSMFKDIVFSFIASHPCHVSAHVENFKFDWVLAPRVETND